MAKHSRGFGSSEPFHIFQDNTLENTVPMTSHAPMPNVTKPARRPLGVASSDANVIFNPPFIQGGAGYSPHKSQSRLQPSQYKGNSGWSKNLNGVRMAPPNGHQASTDSLSKKPFLSTFKTQRNSVDLVDPGKENTQFFPPHAAINLSGDDYFSKPNGKRGLMESAPIGQDPRPTKKAKTGEEALPPHDSFPPITDDGSKPPHSYAQLIGMAILRSPSRKLTLSQIYKFITDNYSFYRPNDSGWQNSIRHNLSLHKNFIKMERPKDDPGKGNYWAIEPGFESQFLKEKPTRKSIPSGENLPVMSTRLEPSRPTTAHTQEPSLPPHAPVNQPSLPALPPAETGARAPEPSSDATIPVSDASASEEVRGDRSQDIDPQPDLFQESPIPANMHSSPPVSRPLPPRSRTPTAAARRRDSSASRLRKSKPQANDDSGYISSLESSVMRPGQSTYFLTSEADRPANRQRRLVAGRAEEEIARMRYSSPQSPTRIRSNHPPMSSSPLRPTTESRLLAPLTPNVRLNPPVRPPPSASPNTTLRLHRDAVYNIVHSPLRKVHGIFDEAVANSSPTAFSPAFRIEECQAGGGFMSHNGDDDLEDSGLLGDKIFGGIDSLETAIASGSPIKKSAKRSRPDRTLSTPMLGRLERKQVMTPASSKQLLMQTPLAFLETPSKVFEGLSSPLKPYEQSPSKQFSPLKLTGLEDQDGELENNVGEDDWPTLSHDTAQFMSQANVSEVMAQVNGDDYGEYGEYDIFQAFPKIGSVEGTAPQTAKSSKGTKPLLGRCHSTTF